MFGTLAGLATDPLVAPIGGVYRVSWASRSNIALRGGTGGGRNRSVHGHKPESHPHGYLWTGSLQIQDVCNATSLGTVQIDLMPATAANVMSRPIPAETT